MELQLPLDELQMVIDSIIDNFNNGAEFDDEIKNKLLLLSAKLDAFTICLYNINY